MAYPITGQSRPTMLILAIVCSIIIFFAGVIFLILWLNLRPHPPKFHIQDFLVSGSVQPNGRITFNITVHNANHRIGIFYDSLDGSVYYKDQWLGSAHLLDPFYQRPKETTLVYHVLYGAPPLVNSQRWMEAVNDRAQGTVDFRVELVSTVRYKTKLWDTKRHRIEPKCDVGVGPDGFMLPNYKDKKCTA